VFSYFGCKSKLARLYPRPKHHLIVEPFAGSARYSLYHADLEIWINDLNPRIYRIWKWLQQATRRDVERLPE
jgi:site-specific DNA-adenine methylase